MDVFRKKTKSGLKVVVAPVQSMQSVTSLVLVNNGSRYEKKEENGISHFLEHMLFKGTEKRPSEAELFHDLDQTGGKQNGLTDKEWTGYYIRVRPAHFSFSLEWLSDILFHSLFRERDIQKEKGVILEERNLYLDTPVWYIWDVWGRLLYGDSPLGRLIIGGEENIKGFERGDFVSYFDSHYNLSNMLLVVAGDTEPSEVVSQAESFFKDLKSGTRLKPEKVVEEQSEPQTLFVEKATDQDHVCLGFRGYGLNHEKRYVQAVLANILGGMRSSRLFIKVRGEKGLAYYLNTVSQNYTDLGYLTTSAGVNKEKTDEAVRAVLEEYQRLREEGVEENEVERAKENLKGGLALDLESSNGLAFFTGKRELFDLEEKSLDRVFQKIEAVEPEEIKGTARELFRPENLNLALIGSKSKAGSIKKIINSF